MARSQLRGGTWRGTVVLAVGMLAAGAFALSPALSAQKSLTKKKADKRYVNVGERASNSDLLDGIDSSGFLAAGGTASNADLLDSMSSDAFQPAYSRTIVVSPGPTEAASGTALLTALTNITGNSATNPFLLKLEPGIYDLGSSTLTTEPFVDIEGSGAGVTIIEGAGSSIATQGTVMLGNNSELRFLTIQNYGGAEEARAVYVNGGGRLRHAYVVAHSGGDNTVGITAASGSVEVVDVLIRTTSESGGAGYGLIVGAPTFVVDSDIGASGGGTPDYGIRVDGSSIEIDRSFLQGSNDAVNRTAGTARIALSRITGGITGTATCAGTYTDAYTFSTDQCFA